MNVKSYLKGIGVGIIVASLILIIAGNINNRMSDADVIKRAKELGMVEASAVNQSTETVVTANTEETKENAEAETKENSAETSTVETTEDKTLVESNTTDTDTDTSEDTKPEDANVSEDNVADSNATDETTDTATENIGETVKVEVRSGMSSESVSLAVKNAGLVDDDTEFNKYLCENGYDKKLRVGSFDIPSGSDFETISKYLCGIK
ncbi:MAG: hypothetical protein IKS56_02755 [Lachnospiraceae bacterium]|nr:hypothetical protein [Lachnospiraceae bacterium]